MHKRLKTCRFSSQSPIVFLYNCMFFYVVKHRTGKQAEPFNCPCTLYISVGLNS